MGKASSTSKRSSGLAALTLAVLLLTGALRAALAADENPFKAAKVGDWVEYKQSTEMAAGKMEATLKQTVTAKDEKTVTLKVEMTASGMKPPAQEVKIDLEKPYDPMQTPGGAKIEKIKEGDETVSAGGKDYKCHWTQSKVTVEAQGMKIDTESKIWVCKEAPLGGMVKLEVNAMGTKSVMEMTGSGKGE